jgi:hypothetical protein
LLGRRIEGKFSVPQGEANMAVSKHNHLITILFIRTHGHASAAAELQTSAFDVLLVEWIKTPTHLWKLPTFLLMRKMNLNIY